MPCCCTFFEPQDFGRATSSRFLPMRAFVAYKSFMTLYFLFWGVWWPAGEGILSAYRFVTYWTFYTGGLYFLVSTITASIAAGRRRKVLEEASPKRDVHGTYDEPQEWSPCGRFLVSIQIFTWIATCAGSLVVVLVYWTVLHEGDLDTTDVNAHLLISIIMIIDQLLVATVYECKFVLAAFVYGSIYMAFNIIWHVAAPEDEKVIYNVMDWSGDLLEAIIFAAITIFVLTPFFSLVHYGLFRFREFIYASCLKSHIADDVEAGRGELQAVV